MNHNKSFLYIPPESCFLAERWLQSNTGIASVQLITPRSAFAVAQALKSQFPAVSKVLILPEDENLPTKSLASWNKALKESNFNKVVLPISMNTVAFRFIEKCNTPDLMPFYPLFRRFWLLGIREFEIFSLNGSMNIRVPFLLDHFKNLHEGKRCFIAGNGPSLNKINMIRLKDEIVFGANRCYLGYKKWGFNFPYWGIMDRLQIEEYWREYEDNLPIQSIKLFPFEYIPLFQFDNACPANHLYDIPNFPQFSDSPDKIYIGYSVTYMLLQIAAIMGCNPIILIGVDHRYSLKNGIVENPLKNVKTFNLSSRSSLTLTLQKFLERKLSKKKNPCLEKMLAADQDPREGEPAFEA